MARYLITGIAGFIGSTLAHTLVEQGHQVQGIDNLSTGRLENLADIRSSIQFMEADIQDAQAMAEVCGGVDYVLHQAALASVPRSVKDPLASHESNVNGTLNVLLAARDTKVKRLVYAASSSAYGDQPTQPKQGRHEAPAAFALRGAEAYGRVLHPGVCQSVWPRRRVPALLQHLRARGRQRIRPTPASSHNLSTR